MINTKWLTFPTSAMLMWKSNEEKSPRNDSKLSGRSNQWRLKSSDVAKSVDSVTVDHEDSFQFHEIDPVAFLTGFHHPIHWLSNFCCCCLIDREIFLFEEWQQWKNRCDWIETTGKSSSIESCQNRNRMATGKCLMKSKSAIKKWNR